MKHYQEFDGWQNGFPTYVRTGKYKTRTYDSFGSVSVIKDAITRPLTEDERKRLERLDRMSQNLAVRMQKRIWDLFPPRAVAADKVKATDIIVHKINAMPASMAERAKEPIYIISQNKAKTQNEHAATNAAKGKRQRAIRTRSGKGKIRKKSTREQAKIRVKRRKPARRFTI